MASKNKPESYGVAPKRFADSLDRRMPQPRQKAMEGYGGEITRPSKTTEKPKKDKTPGKKDPWGYGGKSLGKGFQKRPEDKKINTSSRGSYTAPPDGARKKRAKPLSKNKKKGPR